MEHRRSRSGMTTLFLLLGVWLAVAAAASYQKFQREHVDYPTIEAPNVPMYCNIMMQRRNMASSHHCKHLNTFIHTATSWIENVCGSEGQPTTGDLRESNAKFPLTLCKLQSGSLPPDCKYEGANSLERIIIACEDGYPVHLETEVPN